MSCVPNNEHLREEKADRSGLAECVLFPRAYRAHATAIRGQVLRAEGRVDEVLGAVTLAAERVVTLVE